MFWNKYAKIFGYIFEKKNSKNIFQNIFLKYWDESNFPLEPKFFFFQNHPLQAFLASKHTLLRAPLPLTFRDKNYTFIVVHKNYRYVLRHPILFPIFD